SVQSRGRRSPQPGTGRGSRKRCGPKGGAAYGTPSTAITPSGDLRPATRPLVVRNSVLVLALSSMGGSLARRPARPRTINRRPAPARWRGPAPLARTAHRAVGTPNHL